MAVGSHGQEIECAALRLLDRVIFRQDLSQVGRLPVTTKDRWKSSG